MPIGAQAGFDNPGYRVTVAYFRNPEGVATGRDSSKTQPFQGCVTILSPGDIPGLGFDNPGYRMTRCLFFATLKGLQQER